MKKNLIESILNGIDESMNLYKKWSGDEWLWNAPEYLLTVKIAENISNTNIYEYITLEDKLSYILDYFPSYNKKNMLNDSRLNGRTDITLWEKYDTPEGIIEVKNSVYNFTKIHKDVLRIKSVLENTSIKFGIIAFYIDRHYKENAKEKVELKILKIFEDVEKECPHINCDYDFRERDIIGNNTDYWTSVVFYFKRDDK